jgi:hypothetical protein
MDVLSVSLDNLVIDGFHYGIAATRTHLRLDSCTISNSVRSGIDAWNSVSLAIGDDVLIQSNGRHGISCGKAYVQFVSGVDHPAVVSGNTGSGVSAGLACHVEFDGDAEIADNQEFGVFTWNGGLADLLDNPEVSVHDNSQCQLQPADFASVRRWSGADVTGSCQCQPEPGSLGRCDPPQQP